MKTKSIENKNAAEILKQHEYYTSCIHCLYYSCFQLAKYILNETGEMDYKTQKSNAKGDGSHKFIMDAFFNLNAKKSESVAVECTTLLQLLKRARVRADYDLDKVNLKKANELCEKANEFRTICETNYKI